MAQNFLSCDREQSLLLPPDLRDWLDEDHLAWFVIEAIEEFNLEPFYAAYRADGHGRAAHDPKMMLALLVYAYCVGERSSRGIERRCREDVAFRVVCANQLPDHATIARFRVRHQEALAELFGQVLGLCAEAGLVRPGGIAVDGSKFRAAASDSALSSYEEIAAEVLADAERIDAAEDERYGAARGDELPGQLASRGGRRAWLRDAKRRLDAERAAELEPVPQDRERRLEICHRRLLEDWRAENPGKPCLRGLSRAWSDEGRTPLRLPAEPIRAARGARQQAQHDRPRRTQDEVRPQLHPRLQRPGGRHRGANHRRRRDHHRGWRLRAARADRLRDRARARRCGRDRVPRGRARRRRPPKTRLGGPYDFMRRVLATERGEELYARRLGMVEPIFGQIKANRRIGRFKRRGRAAARSEWRLIAATHNLLKLHRHTWATATA